MNLEALVAISVGIGIGIVLALYWLTRQAAADAMNEILDERGLGRRKPKP